ncbi:MAG: ATP synthase F0 subunit B [Pseudomonadota bacterium]
MDETASPLPQDTIPATTPAIETLQETSHTGADAHADAHGHTGPLGDATFYVLISFIIFCLMAYKFGRTSVTTALDDKIARIRDELAAAEQARLEATQLLQDARQREQQAGNDVSRILKQAKEDAAALISKAASDLDADIARRESQLATRLQRMQEDAKSDLQSYAATLVMQSAEQVVAQAVTEKTHAQLVKATIDSLPDTVKKAKARAA